MPGPREALAEIGSVFLDLVNFGDFPSILVARTPKKPFRHPTEAVPIPHTTTRALPTPTPTAAVHTRTVHGRPRAAGAERFLGMLPSVPHAFLRRKMRRKMPRSGRIWSILRNLPQTGMKSLPMGPSSPPEPARGGLAPTGARPAHMGARMGW